MNKRGEPIWYVGDVLTDKWGGTIEITNIFWRDVDGGCWYFKFKYLSHDCIHTCEDCGGCACDECDVCVDDGFVKHIIVDKIQEADKLERHTIVRVGLDRLYKKWKHYKRIR